MMARIQWKIIGCFLTCGIPSGGQSDSLFKFSHPAMGSMYQIFFYTNRGTHAEQISKRAFDRVNQLDDVLSDYKEHAEVYQLNIQQPLEWVPISKDLGFVLKESIKWSKITGQCFDPAVGALTHLWRRARRRNEFPADSLQRMAGENSGIQFISLQKNLHGYRFKFLKKGVKLDFGGIGKGFAVDEALEVLKKEGVTAAMVTAGSSMAIGAAPPFKKGWYIEADLSIFPERETRYLTHTSRSVSGDRQQFLEWEGKTYSHLVHPITGIPLTEPASCMVEGPKGIITDALGTAFSVMGPEQMRAVLHNRKKINAICRFGDTFVEVRRK
jgi:thiamine biosynthesis lipoprotein